MGVTMMKRRVGTVMMLLAGLSPTPLVLAQASPAAEVMKAEIEAQSVEQALTVLARQSGLQIIYGAETVQGLRSKGTPAGLWATETLQRMLDGTGLKYEFLNDHTVTIVRQPAPVAPSSTTRVREDAAEAGQLEEIVVTATKR